MSLRISCSPDHCEPGTRLEVEVEWDQPQRPQEVSIALLWYTSGRGDEDLSVIERHEVRDALASDRKRVGFTLPRFPYSFSGTHITLSWAIEVAIDKGDAVERRTFIMAPGAREITLSPVADD